MQTQLRSAAGSSRLKASSSTTSRRSTVLVKASGYALGVQVRPYTLRKGDSLEAIAKKRSITMQQLTQLNPDKNPDTIIDGVTILLPSDRLSARDLEILSGITSGGSRLYPVRAGETLQEILSKRGISEDEFQRLNPGVKIEGFKSDAVVLRLPTDKFTVREREMLIGSGVLPREFFITTSNPFVVGLGALMFVCGIVLAWQRMYKDEDEDYVEDLTTPAAPTAPGTAPPVKVL